MPRENHYSVAKSYAERAEQALEEVTDPGVAAQTLALLALTHAVLETGYDITDVTSAIQQHE
ncbi:hypothetical protein [Streptomyces antarcticus]|uniref:hypothetical protein n=1 Tax=Streptomyces antarcticus TaxID=2996458 RepID=UPI00226F9153|nr:MULTISPECIES: hypothetical protein [unclassified Streptomyces]MCY0947292.1 hypothetical protein [Streptomyces sp. H34-AA3]MCZ4086537.1 hypothetical protein [Streptomyces sp. H34-S5]